MSTNTILYFAIGVFVLMIIGIYLTALEFKRINEGSSVSKNRRRPEPTRAHRGVEATDTA